MNTNIHEIADGIYRINTSLPPAIAPPNGFSFNQYLIVDDEPVLFHTGSRRLFPSVVEAIGKVMPIERLRHIAFSHYEQDECGSLNSFLSAAPRSAPLGGAIGAMINGDGFDRPLRVLNDGQSLPIGKRKVRWLDAPHLPHGWECGYLFEETTKTLFCGDLFTQPGTGDIPLTDKDILEPSLAMAKQLDYWAHARDSGALLEKLAALSPRTLACMHGSAWQGDGAGLLRQLSRHV